MLDLMIQKTKRIILKENVNVKKVKSVKSVKSVIVIQLVLSLLPYNIDPILYSLMTLKLSDPLKE